MPLTRTLSDRKKVEQMLTEAERERKEIENVWLKQKKKKNLLRKNYIDVTLGNNTE